MLVYDFGIYLILNQPLTRCQPHHESVEKHNVSHPVRIIQTKSIPEVKILYYYHPL